MDYKEKYREALERAKTLYENANGMILKKWVEQVFPELQESEGEEIRKEIISALKFANHKGIYDKHIAWLEKQGKQNLAIEMKSAEESLGMDSDTYNEIVDECIYGEQKPTDKVEPKFNEGEWVVYECGEETATLQITRIVGETYVFSDDSTLDVVNEDALRLWDITKDAKDGDVLVVENIIFIYKRALASHIVSYCKLINDVFEPTVDARTCCEGNTHVRPATKEQCDLLFQKMKEAGYEWDAEKKELKKIEDKIEIPFGAKDSELQEATYYIPKGFHAEIDENKVVIKKGNQKPAWSKEDEKNLQGIIDEIEANKNDAPDYDLATYDRFLDWLKSLKERMKGE